MEWSYFLMITLGMTAITYVIRVSVIGMAGSFEMSERMKKTLRFVPVTVLPAIIAVEILGSGTNMVFSLENPKVLAATVCTLVSLRFNLVWVVASGVGSLIFFNNLIG